jgi:mannosyltransferase
MSEYEITEQRGSLARLRAGRKVRASRRDGLVAVYCLILLLAFGLRVVSLEAQGVWRDEVDQWRFAYQTASELIGNFFRPGWNGPLYSPVLRGWIELAGDSVFGMRLLSVFWGVLGVAVAAALVRRVAGDRNSVITSLLMAFSPYMVWYAQEIKMYTWVPLLVLLAIYGLERACKRPRPAWWLLVLGATTSAIYSHILAALLVPVLVLWFIFHPSRDPRAWVGGATVLGGLTLPYLPLLIWQLPLLWQTRQTGYPHFTLGQMVATLLNGWSAGISQGPWGTPAALLAISIGSASLALLGAIWYAYSLGWRRFLQLMAWLITPVLTLWAVSQRGPIFTDRYLIWSLPVFCGFVAGGISVLRRLVRPVGLAALVAVSLIAHHGWIAQATVPIKPQFQPVTEIVMSERRGRDLLVFQIPYNYHVADFYAADGLGAWVEAPYTNWRERDGAYTVGSETVGRQMRRLVAGHDRIWLVYSEAYLWDDRELVNAWLMDNYELMERWEFHGVSLRLFCRPTR